MVQYQNIRMRTQTYRSPDVEAYMPSAKPPSPAYPEAKDTTNFLEPLGQDASVVQLASQREEVALLRQELQALRKVVQAGAFWKMSWRVRVVHWRPVSNHSHTGHLCGNCRVY